MPWYPLYHEAFDLDTGSWSSEQVGCLIRLMNHQWANGSIPDAPDHLARICRIDRADWPEIWEILKPKFETTSPGRLTNRRLAVEQKRTQRKSEAARKAAQIRHGKDSKINQPDADAPADDMLSTSTTTTIKKKKEGEARKRAHRLPDDWVPTDKLLTWAAGKVPNVNTTYETEKFKDYFIGKGRTYVDWGRTWQNWMRKANEGGNRGRRDRLGPTERVEQATGVKRL